MNSREIIVLSGGAGTRLWPLSRESFPKQFHDLTEPHQPLLISTLKRLEKLGAPTVLTTEPLRAPTLGFLNRYATRAEVLAEPLLKNTAPAIRLAVELAARRDEKTLIGIFPADHLILNTKRFTELVERAFREAEQGQVVTLGIKPDRPAIEYGYLELSSQADFSGDGHCEVRRFVEKPAVDKAQELIASGRAVWNAGIFVFRADVMRELFRKHLPEMDAAFRALNPDLSNLKEIYASVQSISIDYGIMEKLSKIVCIPADVGWSDIGSWEEISRHGVSRGHPVEVGGAGNFYAGTMPDGKQVAFVGTSDLVAVDTADALLVVAKGSGQLVRSAVEELRKRNAPCLKAHIFEERPWGRFEVLMDTAYFKSKRITVLPAQKLSYQSHAKRAEHWIIVKGVAEVTLNDEILQLKAGDHVFIPLGAKHRIGNPGAEPMEFIEVQTGTYFGEDDIVRYEDTYGRS